MLNQNQTTPSTGFRHLDDAERGTKEATNVDAHVGARLKTFREIGGYSQEALGKAMGGVTFQQVQKYEKGMNRIAPSRLLAAADFLGVTVADFYEGLQRAGKKKRPANNAVEIMELLGSSDGTRLARAFGRIKTARQRAKVVSVIETIADAAEA